MSTAYIQKKPPKKITFIGPEGKAIWIGCEKGLRDDYPKALIIKIE